MPILPPLPRPQRRRNATRDKGHARRLMAILLLHEGRTIMVEPAVHYGGINPEGERATRNQRLVVFRPVGDGVTRLAQECGLKGDGDDQIQAASVSSIQAASILETTSSSSRINLRNNAPLQF